MGVETSFTSKVVSFFKQIITEVCFVKYTQIPFILAFAFAKIKAYIYDSLWEERMLYIYLCIYY